MAATQQTKPDAATRRAEIDILRAEMSELRRRAFERQLGCATTPVEIMGAGLLGTAVAGGFFPCVLLVLDVLKRGGAEDAIAIVAFGSVVGVVYAGFVGAYVFSAVGGCTAFCGAPRNYIYAAAIAGGATGMLCTIPVSAGFPPNRNAHVLVATAIVMGQMGAWWAARKCARAAVLPFADDAPIPHTKVRLSLAQLFRITTVVCIAAAVLTALDLSPQTFRVLAFGLSVHAVAFAAILVAGRVRPQRAAATITLPPGVEEANHGYHR